jgi:hypothetical protein
MVMVCGGLGRDDLTMQLVRRSFPRDRITR